MNKLSKEDLQFLNDLQQEINNEDSIKGNLDFML